MPSGLTIRPVPSGGRHLRVTVTAAGLALHVMIEADVEGRYSDNAFDLTAGESQLIRFTPETPTRLPASPGIHAPRSHPARANRDLGQLSHIPMIEENFDERRQFPALQRPQFPALADVLKTVGAAGYKQVEGYGALYAASTMRRRCLKADWMNVA